MNEHQGIRDRQSYQVPGNGEGPRQDQGNRGEKDPEAVHRGSGQG